MKPTHAANGFEITVAFVIILLSFIMTGIVMPWLISTDRLPLIVIIFAFFTIMLGFVMILQYLFNIFYVNAQKRNKRKRK